VGKQVDPDRFQAVQIKFLGVRGRRLQDDLVLIIVLGSVGIFTVAAVVGLRDGST